MIHRIALFPGELWSFQVIQGLEVEDASPAFLMELRPVPAQPPPEWVLADGLHHGLFSSHFGMEVALRWDYRVETFYRGSYVSSHLLFANC